MNPKDRRYTRDHEWARLEDPKLAQVGITHYAQEQLGDIVYLDLPKVGDTLKQSEKMGEIESVKAVTDLFSPVSGRVVEHNQKAIDKPEMVNQDPYGDGWLLRISPSDAKEVDNLMTVDEYEAVLPPES